MCRFFSCIVTKTEILWDLDIDSHEDLVKKFKLIDTKTVDCTFVRVETCPIDRNILNHDLDNWKTKVEQDYKPDWFDLEISEVKIKEILKTVFKERFIVDVKEKVEIKAGRWFCSGSSYVVARDASSVEARDTSYVEARDTSHVVARDTSHVEARNTSHVVARDTSHVVARDTSYVEARDNSHVFRINL